MIISRRNLIKAGGLLLPMGALGSIGTFSEGAEASTSLVLSLGDLKMRAKRIALGRPVLHESSWITTPGGSRRIITQTRFIQEHDWLKGSDPNDAYQDEIVILTLGGRVGRLAQKVSGEARLQLNEPVLLFLAPDVGGDGQQRIVGMSQGSYPIIQTGPVARLRRSSQLPNLVGPRGANDAPPHKRAAVDALHECEFRQAFSLIRGVK